MTQTYLVTRMKRFVRHYVEMVLAMFVGMAVLGLPLYAVGSGWHELAIEAPAIGFLGMAASMTAPMVAWMRYRGHGWRANTEMSMAMVIPTLAVIGLVWADLVTDTGVLMTIEHVAMLAAMAGAMLLRPAEYAHA
jgi:hypothetical protein